MWGWTHVSGLVTATPARERLLACAHAGTRPSEVGEARVAERLASVRGSLEAPSGEGGDRGRGGRSSGVLAGEIHHKVAPLFWSSWAPSCRTSHSLADTAALGVSAAPGGSVPPVFSPPVSPPPAVGCWERTSLRTHGHRRLLHFRSPGLWGTLGTACPVPQTLCSQPGSAGPVPSARQLAARPSHEPGAPWCCGPPPPSSELLHMG